jgi:hypothetical protein
LTAESVATGAATTADTYQWYTLPASFDATKIPLVDGVKDIAGAIKTQGTAISGATKSTYKVTGDETQIAVLATNGSYYGTAYKVVGSVAGKKQTNAITVTNVTTVTHTSGTKYTYEYANGATLNATAKVTATGKGTGAITYNWSVPDGATPSVTNTVTMGKTGTYTCAITQAADDNYALATTTITITVTQATA